MSDKLMGFKPVALRRGGKGHVKRWQHLPITLAKGMEMITELYAHRGGTEHRESRSNWQQGGQGDAGRAARKMRG
jgi:hypothetical protein